MAASSFDFLAEVHDLVDALKTRLDSDEMVGHDASLDAGALGRFVHFDVFVEEMCGSRNDDLANFVWNVAKDTSDFVVLETNCCRAIRINHSRSHCSQIPFPLATRTLGIVAVELRRFLASNSDDSNVFVEENKTFIKFDHFFLKRLLPKVDVSDEDIWGLLGSVDQIFEVMRHKNHGKGIRLRGNDDDTKSITKKEKVEKKKEQDIKHLPSMDPLVSSNHESLSYKTPLSPSKDTLLTQAATPNKANALPKVAVSPTKMRSNDLLTASKVLMFPTPPPILPFTQQPSLLFKGPNLPFKDPSKHPLSPFKKQTQVQQKEETSLTKTLSVPNEPIFLPQESTQNSNMSHSPSTSSLSSSTVSEKVMGDLVSQGVALIIQHCGSMKGNSSNSFEVNSKRYLSFNSIIKALGVKFAVAKEQIWQCVKSKDRFEVVENALVGRGIKLKIKDVLLQESASFNGNCSLLQLGKSVSNLNKNDGSSLGAAADTSSGPPASSTTALEGKDEAVNSILTVCKDMMANELNSYWVNNKLYLKFGWVLDIAVGKKNPSEQSQLWAMASDRPEFECVRETGPGLGRGIRLKDQKNVVESQNSRKTSISSTSLKSSPQLSLASVVSMARACCLSLVAKVDTSFLANGQRYLKFCHVLKNGFPKEQQTHAKFIWLVLMDHDEFDTVNVTGPHMGRGVRLKDTVVILGAACSTKSVIPKPSVITKFSDDPNIQRVVSGLISVIQTSSLLNAVPTKIAENNTKMMFPVDFIFTKANHENLSFPTVTALHNFLRNRGRKRNDTSEQIFALREHNVHLKSTLDKLPTEESALNTVIQVLQTMLTVLAGQDGISVQDLWHQLQTQSEAIKLRFNCKKVLRAFLYRDNHSSSIKVISPSRIRLMEKSTIAVTKDNDSGIKAEAFEQHEKQSPPEPMHLPDVDEYQKQYVGKIVRRVLDESSLLYSEPVKINARETKMMFPLNFVLKKALGADKELLTMPVEELTKCLNDLARVVIKGSHMQLESVFDQIPSEERALPIVVHVLNNMFAKRSGQMSVSLQNLWCSLQGRTDGMQIRFTDRETLKVFLKRPESSKAIDMIGEDNVALKEGHLNIVQTHEPKKHTEHKKETDNTMLNASHHLANSLKTLGPLKLSRDIVYSPVTFNRDLGKGLGLAMSAKHGLILFSWDDVTYDQEVDVNRKFCQKSQYPAFARFVPLKQTSKGVPFQYVALRIWRGKMGADAKGDEALKALEKWSKRNGNGAKNAEETCENDVVVGETESLDQLMLECTPLDSGFREDSINDSHNDVLSIRNSDSDDDGEGDEKSNGSNKKSDDDVKKSDSNDHSSEESHSEDGPNEVYVPTIWSVFLHNSSTEDGNQVEDDDR